MKLQRFLLLQFGIILLTLFLSPPGFSQVSKEDTRISFSGAIDSIPKDKKFIIVNEMGVYLLPRTKIMSARGTILNKADLRRGLRVTVEGVRKPDGVVAEKITLVARPRAKR